MSLDRPSHLLGPGVGGAADRLWGLFAELKIHGLDERNGLGFDQPLKRGRIALNPSLLSLFSVPTVWQVVDRQGFVWESFFA
jgi:hypothetical protein